MEFIRNFGKKITLTLVFLTILIVGMTGVQGSNTPIGENVEVDIPEANLTFAEVTGSGYTYVDDITKKPSLPSGYNILYGSHNIVTSAQYTGNITVYLGYDESKAVNEKNLKLFHYKEETLNEVFGIRQDDISNGSTEWNLTAAEYPDILCEGSLESLNFIVDGPNRQIKAPNFNYTTSIYQQNGNQLIGWLGEPMNVIEKGSNWYLSSQILDQGSDDSYTITKGDTLNLPEGFAIRINELSTSYQEALVSIFKNGTTVYESTWSAGKVGPAQQFDGVNNYVDVGNTININNSFTILMWVKRDADSSSWRTLISKGESEQEHNHNYVLYFTPENSLEFAIGDGTDYRRFRTTDTYDTDWHHLAVQFVSSDDMRIYVDGVNQSGTYDGTATAPAVNSKKTLIGASNTTTEFFKGIIDEVKIYNRALTDEEIIADYSIPQEQVNNIAVSSPGEWYDDNWKYRKAIEINNIGDNLIDYQIGLTVDTQSLISSGKLKSDGSDLLFVDSNNNVLPLWNEDEFNQTDTTIWVKVPVITNADKTTIHMYYGNLNANSIADGDETFEFFETNFMKPLDNNNSYLDTPTYDESGQAIHPDIYYNPGGWNGYSYWMVMTPYPGGDASYENPSILVSNDGISWTEPVGLTNPIDQTPGAGSNSDTEIVYNEDLDRLEVYYVESGTGTSYLKRRTSTNGTNWSSEEDIFNLPDFQVMSPAIIKDGPTYHMWYNSADSCDASDNYVRYRDSSNGVNWSAPQNVNINQPDQNVWHSDVQFIPSKNEYWMIYAAYSVGSDCSDTELYFATSTDKINWIIYSDNILAKGPSWDSGEIYRATFLYDDNTDNIKVWYSARSSIDSTWHTGYTQRQYSYFVDGLRWSINGNSGSSTTNPRDLQDGNYGLMQVGGMSYPVHELSVRSDSDGSYCYTVWYKDELITDSNYQASLVLNHEGTWSNVGVYAGHSPDNYVRAISGSYADTGIARTPGWHKFEIRVTDTGMYFVIDGVDAGSTTGISSSTSVTPSIEGYSAETAYFDDYYIRKYADPEPTYTIGEEKLEFTQSIAITPWNNISNDDSLVLAINTNEAVTFSVTANQTVTTWNWYKDDINQTNNADNFITSWSSGGTKTITVNAINNDGMSNTITWTVNVIPELPVDGLLAYWKFDEFIGTTVHDSSGNGNTGTLYGPLNVTKAIEEGTQFIYQEDLNESSESDNWVLKFDVDDVDPEMDSVTINSIKLRSPNVLKIETPDDDSIIPFEIKSINGDNTIRIQLDNVDDTIELVDGGVVGLIGDNFKFKITDKDVGGLLNNAEPSKTWTDVTTSIDTNSNTICGTVTNLSEFIVVESVPDAVNDNGNGGSSGGSSSGGGGGGTSGEAFDNIMLSETERIHVYKNADISYSFDLEGNIIRYVNFTSLTSSGKVAAKVEILDNTSSMVDSAPPEIVYKNVNIFVGIAGWATSQNIANPMISFTVEKDWIDDNNIDENAIHMYRYSNGAWKQLKTFQTGEDTDYLFFESETPDGYSQFAVSGKVSTVTPGGESSKPTTGDTTEHIPDEKPGIPGFSLLMGLLVVLIVVQWQRKK